MKKITIGEAEYSIAENASDLNIVRYSALKNIISEGSSGMEYADLNQWFANRRQYYNQSDLYSLMQSEINMQKAVSDNFNSAFSDVSHRIFAIMTLEEGELPHEYDTTLQNDKLKRMAAQGLTQKEVSNETENFIEQSPELCSCFFLMSLVALSKQLKFSEHLGDHIQTLQDQGVLQRE